MIYDYIQNAERNGHVKGRDGAVMGYYQRKFHLQYQLPDGNIWKGMINVDAERKEDLPAKETVRGTFWFFKSKEGWHGEFTLDNYGQQKYPYVITLGVYRPTRQLTHQINSREEAEAMLSYLGMLPEEIYLISGEDNRGRTVRFGFCYSKEEAREAIIRYAKKNFFWCKYEVINVLGDETNDCE